jgi:signal transduction histidine kinase
MSLAVHELRSPLTAVAGYIRLLLKDRVGPLGDQQRRLLEEAEKSCGRLSAVLQEMSELARLESGKAPFNRSTVDFAAVVSDAVGELRAFPTHNVSVELEVDPEIQPPHIQGDAVRLKTAFSAILHALRRELVTSDRLIVRIGAPEAASIRVVIAEPDRIDALMRVRREELVTFDEWRGGTGLSLPHARRIIEAHEGRLLSTADEPKASAVLLLDSGRPASDSVQLNVATSK